MNCQRVQENFWGYQHNHLSVDLRLETSHHLKACPSCAEKFERFKQVDIELDRLGEIEPSPYFDQKLNARLDGLEKQPRWLGAVMFWLKDRYALSFVLLLITTVSAWVGFRHHQAQKLNSMEEVLKVQEKYLGYGEKSSAQTIPSLVMEPSLTPDAGTDLESTSNDEEAIPEGDLAVVENYELLQNYDFLRKFDFADQQARTRPRAKAN
ncbi:MAG: hypothetical protein DMG06_05640 [Acidobacteria bacterium]|nr:MAG: hypothetical protein DMG06_05640 [Acidobacteriota bacterium]